MTRVAPSVGVGGELTSSAFPFGMGAASFLGASITGGVAGAMTVPPQPEQPPQVS